MGKKIEDIKYKLYKIKEKFLSRLNHLLFSHDIRCKIPKGTYLCHGGMGITIQKDTIIGKNVIIYHNVTISKKRKNSVIGDNVRIYEGSIILGADIGNNSIIGAGTFVDKDIPPNSVVYNKKELVIKSKQQEEEELLVGAQN